MKRKAVLCGVIVGLLAIVAVCLRPAEAQDKSETLPALESARRVEPRVPGTTPPPSPLPGTVPSPQPPLREQLKTASIEDLLNKLDALKAQKAELERIEKETVAVLRDKLKEQKERIQKLGVAVDDNGPTPTTSISPAPRKP